MLGSMNGHLIQTEYLTLCQTTKSLGWPKLKAFADDKINVTEKLKFVLQRVENIVGKGENTSYQPFLHIRQCFNPFPHNDTF